MTLELGLSRPTQWSWRPLRCARGPVCFQDEVARQATKLHNLRRSCAWVKDLAEVSPRLREGPLLGVCLATVTGDVQRAGEDGGVDRAPRGKRHRPMGSCAPERQTSVAPEPSQPHDVACRADGLTVLSRTARLPKAERFLEDVSALPRQASPDLLSELAGVQTPLLGVDSAQPGSPGSPSAAGQTGSVGPLRAKLNPHKLSLQPMHFVNRKSTEVSEGRRSAAIDSMGGDQEADLRRNWQDNLTRRAKDALLRVGLHPTSAADREEAVLARQWSATIAGPTADAELLTRMVELSQEQSFVAHEIVRPLNGPAQGWREGTTASVDASEEAGAATSSPWKALPEVQGDDFCNSGRLAPEAGGKANWTSAQHGPEVMASVIAKRTRTGGAHFGRARIVPPTLAPMLPPLVPTRGIGVPAPSPAAVSAERGARAEAAAQEEDLGALSAKIKRILDEEARRHGIDV